MNDKRPSPKRSTVIYATLFALSMIGGLYYLTLPGSIHKDHSAQIIKKTSTMQITSANGMHQFIVEMAILSEQQDKGLAYREELAEDQGMFFPISPPGDVTISMRHIKIPLDILFINAHGIITKIASNMRAFSKEKITAGGDIGGYAEIKGGMAEKLGIKAGDQVQVNIVYDK